MLSFARGHLKRLHMPGARVLEHDPQFATDLIGISKELQARLSYLRNESPLRIAPANGMHTIAHHALTPRTFQTHRSKTASGWLRREGSAQPRSLDDDAVHLPYSRNMPYTSVISLPDPLSDCTTLYKAWTLHDSLFSWLYDDESHETRLNLGPLSTSQPRYVGVWFENGFEFTPQLVMVGEKGSGWLLDVLGLRRGLFISSCLWNSLVVYVVKNSLDKHIWIL